MLDLPVTFLLDAQVRSAATGAIVGLRFLEEEHGTVADETGKLIDHHIVICQIDFRQLLAVMTDAYQKSLAGVILAHPPTNAGTFISTGRAFESAVLTHDSIQAWLIPPDKIQEI